jgi:multisubunit Na+/H+ antiporter MnhC subunit
VKVKSNHSPCILKYNGRFTSATAEVAAAVVVTAVVVAAVVVTAVVVAAVAAAVRRVRWWRRSQKKFFSNILRH